MPVLLSGHTLTPKAPLHPCAMSATLKIDPFSSVNMNLLPMDPAVEIGDWVSVDTVQGHAGVYLVSTVSENEVTGIRQLSLISVLSTLRDCVVADEYNEGQTAKSAKGVLEDLLKLQPEKTWKLGAVEFTEKMPWHFTGGTVWGAITGVLECLDGYQLEMDWSQLPFVLSVKKRPTKAAAEMRMNRNISGATVKIDRGDMFTRFYPTGGENVKLAGRGYIEANTAKWGIVAKEETNNNITDADQLKAWATAKLKRYSQPVISVDINGRDLTELTGLALDKLQVGKLCQAHFEQYGDLQQRIEEVSFPDMLNRPEECRVTLANSRQNVASVVAQLQKKTGGSGRRQSKLEEVIKKYIEETDKGFELVAQRIGPLDSDEARMIFDYDRIKTAVTKSKKNSLGEWIIESQSSIEQTAKDITLKVNKSSVKLQDGVLTIEGARLDVPDIVAKTITADYISSKMATMDLLAVKGIGTEYCLTNRLTAVDYASLNNLTLDGKTVSMKDLDIVTGFTQASTKKQSVTLLAGTMSAVKTSSPDLGKRVTFNA